MSQSEGNHDLARREGGSKESLIKPATYDTQTLVLRFAYSKGRRHRTPRAPV